MIFKEAGQIFFPVHCPICDRAQPRGQRICPECKDIPRIVPNPKCIKCSKHISKPGEIYCYDCLRNPREFDRGFSLFEYASVHDSISTFKNLGRPEYGIYYGQVLGGYFKEELEKLHADALIPIPLHREKYRLRGYNQAEILADEIGKIISVPVYTSVLLRPNKTKVQKNLGRSERRNNMKKAFHIAENDVKLKTVILVDDIYTTGSTIGAAAAVLKTVGAERIFFVTLATGRGY
ncbi:MAG: ComF family protein [Lachnospiraceae bacterium]|nr:ComF family protein [Lachnospiraceae bacterium]